MNIPKNSSSQIIKLNMNFFAHRKFYLISSCEKTRLRNSYKEV